MTSTAAPERQRSGSERPVLAGVYGVDKWFGGVHAVRNATLELRPGEVHVLVGENGAGKSTVVKMLAGVHRPDAGRVVIAGDDSPLGSPSDALRAGVSTVFQELALVPEMTTAENMWLGREPRKFGFIDRAERNRMTARVLEELGITGIRPSDKVKDLGVARQQLLEIARAVSLEGERVVIMDEPTAALSGGEVETLFNLIRRLRERGVAILYITHRLDEIPEIADVVTVMRDREVRVTRAAKEMSRSKLIQEMIGRKLEDLYPREGRSEGEIGLELSPREDGGTIHARRGQVTAIFGLIGSGRTEMLRAAVGADPRPEGMRVVVDGVERRFRSPAEALQAGVVLIPEDRKSQGVIPEMSVASNIALSSVRRLARHSVLSPQRLISVTRPLIEGLRIRTPSPSQKIALLSGGNQQKALIGRAIAARPSVVVFDEPTRGVDVGARVEVYRLINQLCEAGQTVLVITSDLPEALGLSDVLYVMNEGRVTGVLDPRQAEQHDVMELALA